MLKKIDFEHSKQAGNESPSLINDEGLAANVGKDDSRLEHGDSSKWFPRVTDGADDDRLFPGTIRRVPTKTTRQSRWYRRFDGLLGRILETNARNHT